jgi:hypothetical protein
MGCNKKISLLSNVHLQNAYICKKCYGIHSNFLYFNPKAFKFSLINQLPDLCLNPVHSLVTPTVYNRSMQKQLHLFYVCSSVFYELNT